MSSFVHVWDYRFTYACVGSYTCKSENILEFRPQCLPCLRHGLLFATSYPGWLLRDSTVNPPSYYCSAVITDVIQHSSLPPFYNICLCDFFPVSLLILFCFLPSYHSSQLPDTSPFSKTHCPSVSLCRRAGILMVSTKPRIKLCTMTKHIPSYQGLTRLPGVPSASNIVSDISTVIVRSQKKLQAKQ